MLPSGLRAATSEPGLARFHALHATHGPSAFNPGGVVDSGNCGAASVLMAERHLGGRTAAQPLSAQEAIGLLRERSGTPASRGIETKQLRRLLREDGIRARLSYSPDRVLRKIKAGHRVIAAGQQGFDATWHPRVHGRQIRAAHHAVYVPEYERGTGTFVINDPSSPLGAHRVSEAELRTFLEQGRMQSIILPAAPGTPADRTRKRLIAGGSAVGTVAAVSGAAYATYR